MIRVPDFVNQAAFHWAMEQATAKKKMDFSKVEFFCYEEGLCVQCMHVGPYDTEPETIRQMETYAAEQGYRPDLTVQRLHHEIISATQGVLRLKKCARSCVIRCARRNTRSKQML